MSSLRYIDAKNLQLWRRGPIITHLDEHNNTRMKTARWLA